MPRTEARIFTSIWADPDFRALRQGAQWMYLFLLSQRDMAHCGVLPLRETRWAAMAADITVETIQANLGELEAARFILMDRRVGEVMVRSFMRRDQVWKSWNILESARRAAATVESLPLRGAIGDELARIKAACPVTGKAAKALEAFMAEFPQVDELNNSLLDRGNFWGDRGAIAERLPSDRKARGKGEGVSSSSTGSSSVEVKAATSSKAGAAPPRSQKPETRIPEDFAVTRDMAAWCRRECPHVDGRKETEDFTDYWRSKAGKEALHRDWVATWRRWMRKAETDSQRMNAGGSGRITPKAKIQGAIGAGRLLKEARDRQRQQLQIGDT